MALVLSMKLQLSRRAVYAHKRIIKRDKAAPYRYFYLVKPCALVALRSHSANLPEVIIWRLFKDVISTIEVLTLPHGSVKA